MILDIKVINKIVDDFKVNQERMEKYGADSLKPFEMGLEWKKMNVPCTTNKEVLRQLILTKEWIENSPKKVRLWVSTLTKRDFQTWLMREVQGSRSKLNPEHFILLDSLVSWYTIAHFQSKCTQPFFVIEQISG